MKNYKSLSVYKGRDVYIFGASGGGEIVKDYLECHDVPIRAFVDSNEEKWGTILLGVRGNFTEKTTGRSEGK